MTLGLARGEVRLVAWDPTWPAMFAAEAARLTTALAARGLRIRLEHTGSTAVPGLPAKPVLDILGGYPDEAPLAPYVAALESAGYVHRGEQGIPGRHFFRRGDPRAWHLHLTVEGSAFWRDHLRFRDALRAGAALRDAYGALKRQLAARHPRDREAYTDGKGPFVAAVLAGAATLANDA